MEDFGERGEGNAQLLKTPAKQMTSASATAAAAAAAMNYAAAAAVVAAEDTGSCRRKAGQDAWLTTALHVNNNNNAVEELAVGGCETARQKQNLENRKEQPNAQKKWNCESCEAAGGIANVRSAKDVVDSMGAGGEGGGSMATSKQIEEQLNTHVDAIQLQHNGGTETSDAMSSLAAIAIPATQLPNECDYDGYAGASVAGAASLTPPGGLHSNRSASLNNSTENLSYSSENYCHDDLILLEEDDDDDDDAEAEEISLNSDDCVYAYRGDGTDFELAALDALAGGRGGMGVGCGMGGRDVGLIDDETDFLEMDFEPDPLSEVESLEAAVPHADAFLLQRDSCHLSGRHSATLSLHATPTQRQLFSSPIDDELPPAPKALQSQAALLSKNFARITLHLDQINKGGADLSGGDVADDACDAFGGGSERGVVSVLGGSLLCDTTNLVDGVPASTAHSLPSTLHHNSGFGSDLHARAQQSKLSVSPKITGAKPKRLSTFSTSSSTSSKNSSKSRTSLRSAFAPALCSSSSFDERSVSCTEFRSVPLNVAANVVANDDSVSAAVASVATCDDFSTNDEACLDCLEKEFLANTIGKVIDPNDCPKCRKRTRSLALYAASQARCCSGSPSFFSDGRVMVGGDECIFETANDFLCATRSKKNNDNWTTPIKNRLSAPDGRSGSGLLFCDDPSMGVGANQRRATCDNFSGEHLLKNLLLTDKEIATISTLNLTEEMLVQALDKLHVAYNAELIKAHFRRYNSTANLNKSNNKEFKNLNHFLLHESKKNCNHPKLKCLIELATRHQVEAQFKKNINITETEMTTVKVADILHQWTRTKNLELLKQLDKRFTEANVLGKIANIVRQAQQRCCTPRRPLPEYISIPQYYPSGYLTLTKKC